MMVQKIGRTSIGRTCLFPRFFIVWTVSIFPQSKVTVHAKETVVVLRETLFDKIPIEGRSLIDSKSLFSSVTANMIDREKFEIFDSATLAFSAIGLNNLTLLPSVLFQRLTPKFLNVFLVPVGMILFDLCSILNVASLIVLGPTDSALSVNSLVRFKNVGFNLSMLVTNVRFHAISLWLLS
jgi:hypothetical protein